MGRGGRLRRDEWRTDEEDDNDGRTADDDDSDDDDDDNDGTITAINMLGPRPTWAKPAAAGATPVFVYPGCLFLKLQYLQ